MDYNMEVKRCWLCGRNGNGDPLDRHHIFGGSYRNKSEKYGLVVYLCHSRCHIFGPQAAHNNNATMKRIRQYGQRIAMVENNWSTDDFIREFGKNYIEEEAKGKNCCFNGKNQGIYRQKTQNHDLNGKISIDEYDISKDEF